MAAGITAILLGGLGVHKFILGYSGEGAMLLSLSVVGIVLSCLCIPFVLLPFVPATIGVVEGIIYLTKSDDEFIEIYQIEKRAWF